MKQAKVIILDEVNCKIEGMDIETRRRCVNKLKFFLPYARHTPAFKLGRWDGCTHFFSVGGGTQTNLLYHVLPIIQKDGYEISIDDMRTTWDFSEIPDEIDKDYLKDIKWPDDHPLKPGEPIELFPHQVDVINAYLKNLQGIQKIPTAGGKTLTTGTLCKLVECAGRTMTIVPSKQLVNQTAKDYELIGLDVGMYFGDRKDIGKQHTVCTWQSLSRLLKTTKAGTSDINISDFLEGVVCILADEVHTFKADELRKLMTQPFKDVPIRWGLTGTIPPDEANFACLEGGIGPLINSISAQELQEVGVLSGCEIEIVQSMERSKVFMNFPDEQKYLCSDPERIEWFASDIKRIASSGNTLVLVHRISTGKLLEELIEDAVFIDGSVKVSDREESYAEISTTDNKIIIATYGVASVGINVPRIFNLVLFEAGKSFVRTIQSIGRSLRKATDKSFANIYDYCAYTKYSRRHLTERKRYYKTEGYPFKITKVEPDYINN